MSGITSLSNTLNVSKESTRPVFIFPSSNSCSQTDSYALAQFALFRTRCTSSVNKSKCSPWNHWHALTSGESSSPSFHRRKNSEQNSLIQYAISTINIISLLSLQKSNTDWFFANSHSYRAYSRHVTVDCIKVFKPIRIDFTEPMKMKHATHIKAHNAMKISPWNHWHAPTSGESSFPSFHWRKNSEQNSLIQYAISTINII